MKETSSELPIQANPVAKEKAEAKEDRITEESRERYQRSLSKLNRTHDSDIENALAVRRS